MTATKNLVETRRSGNKSRIEKVCQRCQAAPKAPNRKYYCDACAAESKREARGKSHRRLAANRKAARVERNRGRTCSECGRLIPPELPSNRLTCTEACRTARRRWQERERCASGPRAEAPARQCIVCSAVFTPRQSRQITCGPVCSVERNRERARAYQARLREVSAGGRAECAVPAKRRVLRRPPREAVPDDGLNAVQVYHRLRRTDPGLAETYRESLNALRRRAGRPEVAA